MIVKALDGTTSGTLEAPVTARVEFAAFDLLGRKVATIASGVFTSGSHRFTWNPQGAAGVYLVRAMAPGWSSTCRVVYIK